MLIVCPSCATAFKVTKSVLGDAGRQVRCAQCRTVWLATPESAIEEPAMAPAGAAAAGAASAPQDQVDDDADWGAAFAEEAESKGDGKGDDNGGNRDAGNTDADLFAETAMPQAASPSLQPDSEVPALPARARNPDDEPPVRSGGRGSSTPEPTRRRLRPTFTRPRGQSIRVSPPMFILLVGSAILASLLFGREHVVRTVPDSAGVYESIGLPVNLRGVEFRDVKGANEIVDGVVVLVVEGQLVNISGQSVDLPRLRLAVRDAGGKEIYTWTATPPTARLGPGGSSPFRSRLASPPPDGASVEVRFFTRLDAAGR
ncbi:MAG: zinc-ribbon domain-containing protein [Phreatobacter sp.]|uniref:MJ0042-type zinc finger domain-containing protein n=1 Tax=Phreatobacter sp. TaxID=1966341 RepID=UPI002734E0C3|nr:MJ0042-type zinc finger domain-containing protein [Phreatobacter sp.]MDP2801333.1 zinc-ribbon domain-containing protein [Phreatobacter sp.]